MEACPVGVERRDCAAIGATVHPATGILHRIVGPVVSPLGREALAMGGKTRLQLKQARCARFQNAPGAADGVRVGGGGVQHRYSGVGAWARGCVEGILAEVDDVHADPLPVCGGGRVAGLPRPRDLDLAFFTGE